MKVTSKRSFAGASAAVAACAVTFVTPTSAHAAPAPGLYTITTEADPSLCLDADVSSGGLYNNDRVQLYRCNGWGNQIWYWNGQYLSTDPTFCLSVYEGGGAQGADGHKAVVYQCTAATNFRYSVNSDGTVANHWNGKCMDADAHAIRNGDPIIFWTCGSQNNQKWDFHPW